MNALITGASNGIGYKVAVQLASNHDGTVLAVSRNKDKLETLAAEVARKGRGRVVTMPVDLLDFREEDFSKSVAAAGVDHLDILINNAGALVNKPFENLEIQDWENVYATNVFAPARIIRALLPMMGGSRATHIVNIGSYGGYQGSSKFPGLSAYSSSKAALSNLSECLAEELRDRRIRVNCLALGAVDTEMLQQAFPGYTAPLGPDKMSEFIAWFALEGAAFFNGKVLPVALAGV